MKTKYALIINPDAEVEDQAINNFFVTATHKPNFAIIAPYIQEKKINSQLDQSKKDIFEVKNVKGFAMFLNLDQFKEIGFFDENFFIYFDSFLIKKFYLIFFNYTKFTII